MGDVLEHRNGIRAGKLLNPSPYANKSRSEGKYGSEVPEVKEIVEQNSSLRSADLIRSEADKAGLPPYIACTLETNEDPIPTLGKRRWQGMYYVAYY